MLFLFIKGYTVWLYSECHRENVSRPFNTCLQSVQMCSVTVCVERIAFSKGLCLPSCLLWKNQYCSSVFCPGNLCSVPLCPVAQLGNILHYIYTHTVCASLNSQSRYLRQIKHRDSCNSFYGRRWFMMCSSDVWTFNVNLWAFCKPCCDQKHMTKKCVYSFQVTCYTTVFRQSCDFELNLPNITSDAIQWGFVFCFMGTKQPGQCFFAICFIGSQTASRHFPPLGRSGCNVHEYGIH